MTHTPRKLKLVALLLVLGFVNACSDDDDPTGIIPPGAGTLSGNISGTRTLAAETTYTISGFVKVQDGARLVIPAGTKLVGDPQVLGSALFVLPGGRIEANGTAQAPIVFTSAEAVGSRRPGDWGGLILVGRARSNRTGSVIVEGSDANLPNGGPPGVAYTGGTNDADNSGILRYVRVEFAGYGVAQDVELNSFTFAAVGSGTTLEYLEALAGLDDSFEWFGGTVDSRFLVSYEAADDNFDAAEGFSGRNQHLIALKTVVLDPRPPGQTASDPQGFEIDGCDIGSAGCPQAHASEPYTRPFFANFTIIGPGPGVVGTSGGRGVVARRGTGGTWVNGVIARWPAAGIEMRDTATFNRLDVDSLIFSNILLTENGTPTNSTVSGRTMEGDALDASASSTTSLFVAVPAAGTAPSAASLDFTPAASSPIATGGLNAFSGVMAARAGTFVTPTGYRGAAPPSGANLRWWQGWTTYARN